MKKYLKLFAILFFVALFIGTMVYLWKSTRPEIISYELNEVKRDTIINTTIATGSIEPRDEVLVKPQISGIISTIYCEAGQMVKAGDVIASVTVIPEMGQLNSAESRVTLANINLEQVTRNFNRVNKLHSKGVATLEEFEVAENDKRVAIEDLQNARNNLEIVEKGVISSSAKLSNTQVRATITGMILNVPVKVGNSVILSNTFNDGTTIATIADLNDMLFVGNIDETEIGKITEGVDAKITIGALQDIVLGAEIEYVSPKSSDENGVVVFEIKAAVSIPDSLFIRAGYSANAEIVTAKRENIFALSESFVQFKNDSTYVEVLTSSEEDKENQIFERRDIELGLSNGVMVEILSGLDGTEKIKGNKKKL